MQRREGSHYFDDAPTWAMFASRFVRTSPLNGLDRETERAILALFDRPP